MILYRMALRNFKGVGDREIELDPEGVTILEGPNEVGKSSHLDALHLLIEYKDSSKHRDVKAAAPVHRDAGPEAEIEAQAGPYRFRYRKRWIKRPSTELQIIEPSPVQLTGDEAHERVEQILAETVDLDLWRALRVVQGQGLQGVDLKDQSALSRALDVSAGAAPTGDDEKALFDLVAAEYETYWTGTGRPKQELKDAAEGVTALEEEERVARSALSRIQQDVDRLAEVARELQEAEAIAPQLETNVEEARIAREAAAAVEKDLTTATTTRDLAKEQLEGTEKELGRRDALDEKLVEAQRKLSKHQDAAKSAPDLDAAKARQAEAEAVLVDARANRQAAEDELRACQTDEKDRHYQLDLDQMLERRDAIDAARDAAEGARRVLATSNATPEAIETLRSGLQQHGEAQARLDSASARAHIHTKGADSVDVNGAQHALGPEGAELPVEEETRITVPGSVEISIIPGGDIQALRAEASDANHRVQNILKDIGAKDLAGAVELQRLRDKAAAQVEALLATEKEKLRDLSGYDELAARIEEVEHRLADHTSHRDSKRPMPADFDEARQITAKADEAYLAVRAAETAAIEPFEEASKALDGARARHQEIQQTGNFLQEQANSAQADVNDAEAESPIDELQTRTKDFAAALEGAERELAEVQQRVEANDPEAAKARLENAVNVLQDHDRRLQGIRNERTTLKTRLEVHEEDGLFEQLQTIETSLDHARRTSGSLHRRAQAAKLVYDVLREERDQARQAYIQPLKERIEKLGRLLYGEAFHVSLSEDLQVETRTMGDITVPFESLSAGAKEQLGILTRIACATLVAKEGKIPLILDDTLGNTDPSRLVGMGTVLARAGDDCQVIVLTCVPDRFRHVGGARVVRLAKAAVA